MRKEGDHFISPGKNLAGVPNPRSVNASPTSLSKWSIKVCLSRRVFPRDWLQSRLLLQHFLPHQDSPAGQVVSLKRSPTGTAHRKRLANRKVAFFSSGVGKPHVTFTETGARAPNISWVLQGTPTAQHEKSTRAANCKQTSETKGALKLAPGEFLNDTISPTKWSKYLGNLGYLDCLFFQSHDRSIFFVSKRG